MLLQIQILKLQEVVVECDGVYEEKRANGKVVCTLGIAETVEIIDSM